MDYNQKTLQTYEDSKQEYINKTPDKASPHVTEWIDRALVGLKKPGSILEIGSAFGRDADYMESKGYKVQRTDAAKAFVDLLQSQGKKARVLNVLTDDLGGLYDMVIANAVFLHFKKQELTNVLSKIYANLRSGGILAFSVKEGKGSEWSSKYMNGPRFFRYWQPEPLRELIVKAGYKDIQLTKGKSRHAEWLHVIAKR